MPARPSCPPRGIPVDFPWLSRLPQGKIQRIFFFSHFILTNVLTGPDFQRVQRLPGKGAVVGKLTGPVVNVAGSFIRVALLNQGFNHFNNSRNIFRCPRVQGGRLHVERRRIGHKRRNVFFSQFRDGNPLFGRRFDHFVINIGKVRNIINLVAFKLQVAAHCIKGHNTPGIPDVNVIVHRWPTHIHIHHAWGQGRKFFFLAGQGVINFKHRPVLPFAQNQYLNLTTSSVATGEIPGDNASFRPVVLATRKSFCRLTFPLLSYLTDQYDKRASCAKPY